MPDGGQRPVGASLPGVLLIVPVKYQISYRYAYEFMETGCNNE